MKTPKTLFFRSPQTLTYKRLHTREMENRSLSTPSDFSRKSTVTFVFPVTLNFSPVINTMLLYVKYMSLKYSCQVRTAVVHLSNRQVGRGVSSRKWAFNVGEPPSLLALTVLTDLFPVKISFVKSTHALL